MSKARETVETLRTVLVDGDVTNANFTGADLEVGKGGTGASSAGAARTALGVAIGTDVLAPDGDGSALTGVDSLPSQTSQSGKFLTTNGSAASWGEAGGSGSFLRITRYTTAGSGTWTKPSDTVSVLIKTIAGGGGGSGSASSAQAGSGGSSGGYAEKYIAAAASSYAYVVGAGGAGGTTGADGSAGGETTIAGISGGAGARGKYQGNVVPTTPSGGDINVTGSGGTGGTFGNATSTFPAGGCGGTSPMGGGGQGLGYGASGTAGGSGVFGSGGGGGGPNDGGARAGGAGGAGYIEIQEYS